MTEESISENTHSYARRATIFLSKTYLHYLFLHHSQDQYTPYTGTARKEATRKTESSAFAFNVPNRFFTAFRLPCRKLSAKDIGNCVMVNLPIEPVF